MDSVGDGRFCLSAPIGRYVLSATLFPAVSVQQSPSGAAYRHRHACFELAFVEAGEFMVCFDGDAARLSPGDVLLIAPGENHSTVLVHGGGAAARKYSLLLSFSADGASRDVLPLCAEADALVRAISAVQRFRLLCGQTEAVAACGRLFAEAERRGAHALALRAGLELLLDELAAALTPLSAVSAPRPSDDLRIAVIEDFFDFQVNSVTERTPAALAAALGVSVRHMNRVLNELYQKSFSDMLLDARMNAANFYLTETDIPVGDIAERLGYGAESSFYLAYRHYYRTTPYQFRRAWRKK